MKDDALIDALTAALVEHPAASLGELAAAVGVGRTTLHRRFPTRTDVLHAVGASAAQRFGQAYADAHLELAFVEGETDAASLRRLADLVARIVPIGPQIAVLFRAGLLDTANDPHTAAELRDLDAPLHDAIARGRRRGVLDRDQPTEWLAETLLGLAYIAWEQRRAGTIGSAAAGELAFRLWLGGASSPPAT